MNKENMSMKSALELAIQACERSALFFDEQESKLHEGYDRDSALEYRNAKVFLGVLLLQEK